MRRAGGVFRAPTGDTTPPPAPGAGFAGPTTVGPQAVVTDATLGAHTDQTGSLVDLGSADITVTANGETVSLKKTTGRVIVGSYTGVTITNCQARNVTVNNGGSATVTWCRLGALPGVDKIGTTSAQQNAQSTHEAIGNGGIVARRCEIYGVVDGVKHQFGAMEIYDCWFHDGYKWTVDPGQGGSHSHVDVYQALPTAPVTKIRFVDNRVDAWCFREDEDGLAALYSDTTPQGTAWYNLDGPHRFTTGILLKSGNGNQPTGTISDVLIKGNRFDGNTWAWISVVRGDTTTAGAGVAASTSVTVEDNLFKKRFTGADPANSYGARRILDTATSTVVWDNNSDMDTSAIIYVPGVVNLP